MEVALRWLRHSFGEQCPCLLLGFPTTVTFQWTSVRTFCQHHIEQFQILVVYLVWIHMSVPHQTSGFFRDQTAPGHSIVSATLFDTSVWTVECWLLITQGRLWCGLNIWCWQEVFGELTFLKRKGSQSWGPLVLLVEILSANRLAKALLDSTVNQGGGVKKSSRDFQLYWSMVLHLKIWMLR